MVSVKWVDVFLWSSKIGSSFQQISYHVGEIVGTIKNICSEICPQTATPAWLSSVIPLVPVLSCVCNAAVFDPYPLSDTLLTWCDAKNKIWLPCESNMGMKKISFTDDFANSHFKEFHRDTFDDSSATLKHLKLRATAEVWRKNHQLEDHPRNQDWLVTME